MPLSYLPNQPPTRRKASSLLSHIRPQYANADLKLHFMGFIALPKAEVAGEVAAKELFFLDR